MFLYHARRPHTSRRQHQWRPSMAADLDGLRLAEGDTGRNRRVIATVGDGSAQYSIQASWTAAQPTFRLPS